MNPMDEVLKNLAEDRRALERERLRARIQEAFDSVRVVPVAEPPTTEPVILCELLVEPPVPAPRPPLSKLAQPLLQQIQTDRAIATHSHRRRFDGGSWEIEEPVVDSVPQLLLDCEIALGLKPKEKPVIPRRKR
jgi:hypothetical protein